MSPSHMVIFAAIAARLLSPALEMPAQYLHMYMHVHVYIESPYPALLLSHVHKNYPRAVT